MFLIRELLTYITERPALSEAKSFGHLFESISLVAREARCKKNWGPHRASSKNFIESHLSLAQNFDSVLILGSGPLHEIPIDLLSKKFKRVVLVDIVHLKSTKKSVAHLSNIEFVEHDLTEVEHFLHIKKELKNHVPTSFTNENWGLVLSVNVMSQLPLHLNSYIHRKFKSKFSESDVTNYLENITRDHFEYLKSFKANALLITDIDTFYYDKKDSLLQTNHNYAHLNLPTPTEEWNWNVAPIPEFQKDIGMKMRVGGFVLKNINSR